MVEWFIELHDSRLGGVVEAGGDVVFELSTAILHRKSDQPGEEPATVWTQRARLVVGAGSVGGVRPAMPGWIMDGTWTLDSVEHPDSDIVPIPLDVVGEVEIELGFSTGERLRAAGRSLRLELEGEPEFLEVFPV